METLYVSVPSQGIIATSNPVVWKKLYFSSLVSLDRWCPRLHSFLPFRCLEKSALYIIGVFHIHNISFKTHLDGNIQHCFPSNTFHPLCWRCYRFNILANWIGMKRKHTQRDENVFLRLIKSNTICSLRLYQHRWWYLCEVCISHCSKLKQHEDVIVHFKFLCSHPMCTISSHYKTITQVSWT